ncbi:DUF1217 domain-containing protein [Neoroseomonas soli]|uniref:DUF1217 domain-containing protein n=1 Tax=Neoroseomonas soli TaxID=1081025 RepID=A0A9X9X1X1_9PROT|nr:DUF1217 domain-containing protein [Neoroseomonas soli]MBR0673400.1 DUF1217 domain-containing protein [Neoroseomonas soli]
MVLSLNQVQALFGVSASGASSGGAAAAIPALRRATAEGAEAKGIAREKKDPVTLSALAQFRTALDKAGSIEKALRDPRILKVLLPALGLAGQEGNAGLVQRALLSDPDDRKGLAAALGATWKAAANTLGVHKTGLDGLRDPAMVQRLSDAFLKYQYRSGLDDQQAGLSDALYFLESARNADDVYDVLGDPVLRRVVTGALGLPDRIAIQSVEAQGRAVSSRLKIDALQDGRAVRKLAERYLIAAADKAVASASAQSSDAMTSIINLSIKA